MMTSENRIGRGWLIALAILLLGFASLAIDSVFHFKDSALDGPFQLFNGIRRIVDGQRLGGTFQVFHGPGIPYLHLIPYWLFGGTFLASEMSRQVVSVVAALGVLLAFFRAWTGSWRSTVPLSVAALGLFIPLRLNALPFPTNSMIGLRSTMPIIIGIHLLLRSSGRRAMIERAGLFALALMFGIEQGMAAIAGYGTLQLLIALRTRDWREPLRGLATIALGVATYAALIFIMTPSGFASVMQFNFKLVPGDQMWYFGAPPNQFFFAWIHLTRLFEHPIWSFMVLGAVIYGIARYWQSPGQPDAAARTGEAFLVIYAVFSTASMLGTFTTVYFQPATRVALFVLLLGLRRWWLWRKDSLPLSETVVRRLPVYAAFAVLGYAAAGWTLSVIEIVRTPLHILYAHVYLGDRPTMSEDWRTTETIGEAILADERTRLGREPILWSTYSSYLEYKHNYFHPFFDYIIHALGHENREAYARTFERTKPDVVQTLTATYTAYEEWLALNHWNFYRPLLRDYEVTGVGPWSSFWTRAPQPFKEDPFTFVKTSIPPGNLGIQIDGNVVVPRDSLGLFEVRLFYHIRNPWKRVPVLGTLPRYLVIVGGAANHVPVSLVPYENEKRFPVIAVGPKNFTLLGRVFSIMPGVELAFDSIQVERLKLSPANAQWARDFIIGPPRFNPDTASFGPADRARRDSIRREDSLRKTATPPR
jgi:hypothetical protein